MQQIVKMNTKTYLKKITIGAVAMFAALNVSAQLSDKKIASIFALEKVYLNNAFKTVQQTGKLPRSTQDRKSVV